MMRRETPIDITVMICTWNNPVRLGLTLAAFGNCRIPAGITWEILVVNNDGSETTDDVVARHRGTLPIVLAHEPLAGLSRARNRGLRTARGKLIVFTDDDVTVDGGWLDAYWAAYAARSDCFLGGPIRSQFDGRPPDPRVLRFAPPSVKGLDYGPGRRILAAGEYFIGPNWACPRALLDKVGGFDESRGLDAGSRRVRVGEETDLMRRLQAAGACAVYLPDALLDHHVPEEKTTLTHVAQRAQAAAYDGHMDASSQAAVATVLGYPRWRLRGLLEAVVVTAWRRIAGGDWVESYVEAHQIYGVLRATRDAPKHRARAVDELPPTAPSGLKTE